VPVVVVVVVDDVVGVGLVGVSPLHAPVSAAPAAPSRPNARRRLTVASNLATAFDILFLSLLFPARWRAMASPFRVLAAWLFASC
jgi:hypothetical protein